MHLDPTKPYTMTFPNEKKQPVAAMAQINFDFLPTELKLHILGYALRLDHKITAQHRHTDSQTLLSLLCTSKAINILAAEIYYGINTFIIERTYGSFMDRARGHKHPRHRYPPFALGHLVRKLHVHIDIGMPRADYKAMLERMAGLNTIPGLNQWLVLLQPRDILEYRAKGCILWTETQADWQKHFPRLHTLRIVVTGMHGGGCISLAAMERMHWVAKIYLKPRKLEMEIERILWMGGEPLERDCGEVLEERIRGIVELREMDEDV